MDHIVYLNHKAKELENLINGSKSMIIRGAMGRKLPYGILNIGDVLYFAENNGDGLVKAKLTRTNLNLIKQCLIALQVSVFSS